MRRLLVCQHVAHEILGTLDPLLRDSGFRIRYVNFGREPDAKPDINKYDGLIILGGPMNCDQVERYPHLKTETQIIRDAVQQDMPVLGVCLGAQLLARALGARVVKNKSREIGWYELNPTADGRADPLFENFASSQQIFQWHGDRFEIPHGAVRLASSPDCANQAFRFGDKVYGLQFHLEVDEPMINRWLHTPANSRELTDLGGEQRIAEILRDTAAHIDHSIELGNRIFSEFIRLFRSHQRRITLPSR